MTIDAKICSPLYIVGLGPGSAALLTPQAKNILGASEVIAGYSVYLDLLNPDLLKDKKVIKNAMRGELERCNLALDAALEGKTCSLVCSGDAGVYALAGLVYELCKKRNLLDFLPNIIVIPGIPALCAAAARLGAPLTHDFACISLSDLLTPWEKIEKRIFHAFKADFVVVVYNPRSKKRAWQLDKLVEIAKEIQPISTPVGFVRNAYRSDEEVIVSTLEHFDTQLADMFSIVIVGNSQSEIIANQKQLSWKEGARIFTPRGYANKYLL